MTQIRLGISTCPNDTFAFHGLMTGAVDCRGIEFSTELIDIQQLNDRLFQNAFDIAKTSFHAALLLADDYVVLPSGSALGFGVGPLLLSAKADDKPSDESQTTLCPGKHTTATLLFKLFHPQTTSIQHVVFSDIMPELQNGNADFGVCIHEGRFTWRDQGLGMVEDLGVRWEKETDCPLPLGGIVASRKLSDETISNVQAVVRDSIEYGLANKEATFPTMREYAQEFDDDVLMQHVELYVNDWTVDLGETGKAALAELGRRADSIGLTTEGSSQLQVFGHQ